MDSIDTMINDAEQYVMLNHEALNAAFTYHPGSEDFDIELQRAVIDRLFRWADDEIRQVIHAYVTFARGVRLGVNTASDTLTPEQRQRHEIAVSGCERQYVETRTLYHNSKDQLSPLEQQIVERLVAVDFIR